nr:response regulator [Desulfobulbus alkaliphilus]
MQYLNAYLTNRDLNSVAAMLHPKMNGVGTGADEIAVDLPAAMSLYERDLKNITEPIEFVVRQKIFNPVSEEVVVALLVFDWHLKTGLHQVSMRGLRLSCVLTGCNGSPSIFHMHLSTASAMHDEGESYPMKEIRLLTDRLHQEIAEKTRALEKFRHLFEGAENGILVARGDTIEFANPALKHILGHDAEKITSEPFITFIHPDDRATVLDRHIRRMRGEDLEKSYDFRVVASDGSVRWINLSAQIINWDGDLANLSFVNDITERKTAEKEHEKLQEQLFQAQKMETVGRLAGGVAHDFNNMLGVILGYSEMALSQMAADHPLHGALHGINQAAQRSADLTRQLLAFARKQTITPRIIDLNETVEGMLKMLRRLIGEDIDLIWLPGRNLCPVKMDPAQIDLILANLCVNARDAIKGHGKVTIETGLTSFDDAWGAVHTGVVPGEYVLLAVSDNGCGMDQETINHMFEPFFTTKEQGQGTGLGLASVYGAVTQNNGFIDVESEPGQGATFKIYLPQYVIRTEPLPVQDQVGATMRGHETILLVEDEPVILKMLRTMLEHQGYTVLTAGSPEEAIRLAEEHSSRIDLLMTDVVMPGMNGLDLARNLLSRYPGIKTLFMSGYTDDVIAHHGVLDEGVHFIQKPFSMRVLGEKLREALEG